MVNFDYSANAKINETIAILLKLGLPPLPVAPKQDSRQDWCHLVAKTKEGFKFCPLDKNLHPIPRFTGKNPSYLSRDEQKVFTVKHKDFQDKLPTDEQLRKWFANPNTGVGTLGGHAGIDWLDIDRKNYDSQFACDREVEKILDSVGQPTWVERTGSGGYRIAVKPQEKPRFTNFATSENGPHVGEALSSGRFTVLAPTIHPNGNPYQRLDWADPAEVESLEAIGIYQYRIRPVERNSPPISNRYVSKLNDFELTNERELASKLLEYIDPNLPYDDWLKVGMALESIGDDLLSEWDVWSSQGGKYQPGECEIKWRSFRGSGITIATLVYFAKLGGFEFPKTLEKFNNFAQDEPNEAEYQAYLEWEKEQELIEEAISNPSASRCANEEFITWLKAKLFGLSKCFKGFQTKNFENVEVKIPETIEYLAGNPLPTLSLYRDLKPPRIKFKKGDRLQLLTELKRLGWRRVLDRSLMGLGKSYDAGRLRPEPKQNSKIWYLDPNHRNVSTETVKENKTDLNPRHDGLYYSFYGLLCVAKNKQQKEQAVIPSNCHLADLFRTTKEKWHDNFENDDGSLAPNPICGQCKFNQIRTTTPEGKEVSLCAGSRGDGYGYRFERRQTLAQREIRADIHSLPNPNLQDTSENNKTYDYSEDICFVEEASNTIRGIKTLEVTLKDFDKVMMDLASKSPELFNILQPKLNIIRELLRGNCPEKMGNCFGLEHQELLELLQRSPFNLEDIIDSLANHSIKVSDVIISADNQVDLKQLPKKLKRAGYHANQYARAEAWRQTLENLENLHANWLLPLLRILKGERGTLRFNKNAKRLVITRTDERATQILNSMAFVVLLDATGNKNKLARILDCDPKEIIEIEEEAPPLTNLKVINIESQGLGSGRWSESALARCEKFAQYLRKLDPNAAILGLKRYAVAVKWLDGYWWNDSRGTNKFAGKQTIATFGSPQPHVGAIKDEYFTLFNTHDGFEKYYQSLIEAEFTQLTGRFRAHRHPEIQFTYYAIGTNLNLDFLARFGCEVENRNVEELCPEAATRRQADKWKMFQIAHQTLRAGKKLTQKALANGLNSSQSWISKLFDGQTLTWSTFKKIFLALYNSIQDNGMINPDRIDNQFLREFLELDPIEVIRDSLEDIRKNGWELFCDMLMLAAPDVRMGILGLLTASMGIFDSEYESAHDALDGT